MPAVVTVSDLRKRYRARDPWAVDGVSFQLETGQAFGLLGPNGAGKTTVVKMIAGSVRTRIEPAYPLSTTARPAQMTVIR